MLGDMNLDEAGEKITLVRTEKSRFSYLPLPVRNKTPSRNQRERRPLTASCNRRREIDLSSDEHIPGTILDSKVFHSTIDVSHIRSRICSFDNILHQPQTSNRKIFNESPTSYNHIRSTIISPCASLPKTDKHNRVFNQKSDFSNVGPLVSFRDNEQYTPGGGKLTIIVQKLSFRETARPKIDAKSSHIPKPSGVSIPIQKLTFRELATSRIDSRRALDLKESPRNTRHLIDLLTMSLPDIRTRIDSPTLPDHFKCSMSSLVPRDSTQSQDYSAKEESLGGLVENES